MAVKDQFLQFDGILCLNWYMRRRRTSSERRRVSHEILLAILSSDKKRSLKAQSAGTAPSCCSSEKATSGLPFISCTCSLSNLPKVQEVEVSLSKLEVADEVLGIIHTSPHS